MRERERERERESEQERERERGRVGERERSISVVQFYSWGLFFFVRTMDFLDARLEIFWI